jgi:SEC-C motif-containing protein
LHLGSPASSAEALMRSRYSAFYLDLPEYIARSWHQSTRPPKVDAQDSGAEKTQWIGLRVKRHKIIDADNAVVEFVARYKVNRQIFTLHEISRFVRESGHWFYLDGTTPGR